MRPSMNRINSTDIKSPTAIVAGGPRFTVSKPSSSRRREGQTTFIVSAGPRVRRILIPVDFSSASRLALRYAAPLAQRLGATITLIYVEKQTFLGDDLLQSPQVLPDEDADAALTSRLIELAAQEVGVGFPVETIVRRGQESVEIVEAAKALRSDLILMPTNAYTGLKRALYGSTAEDVMRHAQCPVCTIRNEVLPKVAGEMLTGTGRRNILVLVDFSECSRQALRFAGAMATQAGGSLALFHIDQPSDHDVPVAVRQMRRADSLHRMQIEEKLAAWAAGNVPPSVPLKTLVLVGTPSPELIEHGIRLLGTDLIVKGSHEYSWMRRLFEGGGTERMARLAPCPVVTVHS